MIHLRKRALYLVLFSALILFGISAVGGFLRLNDHQNSISQVQPETGLWHATQLEVAYTSLLEALAQARYGDGETGFTDIAKKTDLLWNRINRLQEDMQASQKKQFASHRPVLNQLKTVLGQLDENLPAIESGDPQAIQDVQLGLQALRTDVHQIALTGLESEFTLLSRSEDRVNEILNRLAIDLIALGLSVAVIVYLLARQINVVELTRREANEAKEALAQAIEGVSEGFALFDSSDRLIMANSVYREIYDAEKSEFEAGTPFEDMCKTSVAKGLHVGAVGKEKEWIARRLAAHLGEEPFEEQMSDGRWILASDQRILNGGMVAIRSDITDRKKAEIQLRDALHESRTATKAKSEFLAIMSHEMRTPLNGVIGLLGLLLDSRLDPEQRGYIMTARESGEMLLSLIEDVLDFSKIEAGKLELEETSFDPTDLVAGVMDLLAPRAHAKGVEVVSYVDPSVPVRLIGDPGRLRQIIFNLAGNAVKFTERGGITVELALAAEDDNTIVLSGAVTDTGIGIPYDAQESLFAEFIQLDASYSRRFGGTGLGLTITRRLVEAMNGAVWVNSEPGRGSVFSFTVQLKRDVTAAQSRKPEKSTEFRNVLFWLESGITSDLLIKTVRGAGHRVINVQTENDAMAQLAGNDFDVVLIDCRPQDETGFFLARKLRDAGVTIPIFLLRPYGTPVREDSGLPTDAVTGILSKPLQEETVQDALATLSGEKVPIAKVSESDGSQVLHVGKGYRILLAEDSPTNRMVASVILRRAGFRVDWVMDGIEAVEAVKRLPYDLILMDISMPNMDGEEATKEIRALDTGGAKTPIIALTAHAMPGDRERFLAAGMDDYLTKPLRGDELLKAIGNFCPPKPEGDLVGETSEDVSPIPAPTPQAGQITMPERAAVRQDLPESFSTPPKNDSKELSPVVDHIVFRQLQEDAGEEAVPQLIEVFLDELVGRVARISDAQPEGDADSIAREAHALKSSAGSFGAMKLHFLAKDVEKAARQDKTEILSDLVPRLTDTGRETERQFRDLIS